MAHHFQINLRGIIDLLSKHLYSGPEVFVRELLQNAVDAIRARLELEPDHEGEISFELHTPKGKLPTLIITDNGIGLTEEEVHRFLATIGESSKRVGDGSRPTDFIGQFGVGLLSCFTVSEEIVVISRSAKSPAAPAVEWRGRPDGTYDVKTLNLDFGPGTQVCLTARSEHVELFAFKKLVELGKRFGVLLPYPIKMNSGAKSEHINEHGVPWRQEFTSEKQRQRSLLAYGKDAFGRSFLEAIPLKSKAGDVDGVAYVLPHEVSPAAKREDRVYLKNMLLSDKADNLLPEWAFFVKAIVNANALKPTASRESFYEDYTLDQARDELGNCLRAYLYSLAEHRPEQLRKFVSVHVLALKALAKDDDQFFNLIIDVLPFQTNRGQMAFSDLRQQSPKILVAPTVDQFRQVEKVAGAQGLTIVNGGYTYDQELLARAGDLVDGVSIEEIGADTLVRELEEPSEAELEAAHQLLLAASVALRPFRCEADLKKFAPHEVPVIFASTQDGQFFRSLERSKEVADPLWSGVLASLGSGKSRPTADSRLTLNAANPLIKKLISIQDATALKRFCEMLYVQGLLLAHQPLSTPEMTLMNEGLIGLATWGSRVE